MKHALRNLAAMLAATATLCMGLAAPAYADEADGTQQQAQAGQAAVQADPSPQSQADTRPRGTGDPTAPDVSIHDMLDSDAAYISRLKLTGMVTGTAPYDADDARGDDSGPGNMVVRSFDTVTYNYDYTITPDDTMAYYRRARVGFRFELPYPKSMVTFDPDSMGWSDTTKGYEPKTTTETINGVETQVFTCYRLLEPTSSSPMTVPGTSSINLAVKVAGAPNGYKFHPTVKAWAQPNDRRHRTARDTPADVTVSAKMGLNLSVDNLSRRSQGRFDFSADGTAVNHEKGKVRGLAYGFTMNLTTRNHDLSKGLKGLEMPQGPISFDVKLSNVFNDEGSAERHPAERKWQPLLWNWGPASAGQRTMRYSTRNAYDWDYLGTPYIRQSQQPWTIIQTMGTTGVTLHVTVNDWMDDPLQFAKRNWNGPVSDRGCSGIWMDGGCNAWQVGALSTQLFNIILPTYEGDTSVAKYYGGRDQTLNLAVSDANLNAASPTGDRLPAAADNSNQTATNDDRLASTGVVRSPGGFIQRIYYTSCDGDSTGACQSGMDGLDWTHDWMDSTDSGLQGQVANIGMQPTFQQPVSGLPVGVMGLAKIDPTVMQFTPQHMKHSFWHFWTGNVGRDTPPPTIYYATKKDGSAWASDDEQRRAGIGDLDYWNSMGEAKKHGTIVAALFVSNDAAASGYNTARLDYFARFNAKVRDDAPLGAVGQITGVTVAWKRSDVEKLAGLDPETASDKAWTDWAARQDFLRLFRDGTRPSLYYDGSNYEKAVYDENGYAGGGTGSNNRGDSLLIVGEKPRIGIAISQTAASGGTKSIYDLDKEQRTADWRVGLNATTGRNGSGGDYTTDLYATVTLPKGLAYVSGSSHLDGTYTEHTPEQGTVSGGTRMEPQATANADGTTTLKWTVNGVRADGSTRNLRFSTTIGDAADPDHDARNNDSYTVTASVTSKRNKAKPDKDAGTIASATIKVSRTHASALATRANPLLNDIASPLGFSNMLANPGNDAKPDPYAVDIMPYTGPGSPSKYEGSYTLTGLKATGANGASPAGTAFWFTTDTRYRTMDAAKITRRQVESWHKAVFDPATGVVAIPAGYGRPVAWGFTAPSLPANARYDFTMTLTPAGNKSGSAYVNRWADGDNKVDAVTQAVEREASGIAWYDYAHDGIRQTTDMLLPGVHVTLTDADGRTVRSLNGGDLATTTGRDGSWKLSGIPAGAGYRLRFTPADHTDWRKLAVTVKDAKDASEANDSDTDPETDANGLTAGVVALRDFPAVKDMAGVLYSDSNEDHGLAGRLGPETPVSLTASKSLAGRPGNKWLDGESYTANITAVGKAPADALPKTVTFTDSKPVTLNVKPDSFTLPGTYRYEVRESKGTRGGVTYDTSVWTVTVTVTDDPATLRRHITATAATGGKTGTAIVFRSTYTPAGISVTLNASKKLIGPGSQDVKLVAGRYTFQLKDADGNLLQSATNKADGSITFQPIRFTAGDLDGGQSASRDYLIVEKDTCGPDCKADATVHRAHVTVTDDDDGRLAATVSYDGKTDAPVFRNTVTPLTTLPLTGGRLDDPMPIAYALLLAGMLAMGTAIHSRRRHGAHCA